MAQEQETPRNQQSSRPFEEASALHVTLDSMFLYQNQKTGEVSKTSLSAKQLCRILCPAPAASLPIHITPDTQLLLQDPDGSYSTAGWKAARSVPVLREAIATWYYDKEGEAVGPVSCRSLASLVVNERKLDLTSRVYSNLAPEWKAIGDLTDLQIALDAFYDAGARVTAEQTAPKDKAGQGNNGDRPTSPDHPEQSKAVMDELEAFLTSTDRLMGKQGAPHEEEEESYESDGGTRFVKDLWTGRWIHEDLAAAQKKKQQAEPPAKDLPMKNGTPPPTNNNGVNVGKKKRKKPKFSSKNARCWVYVTGLPTDCTADEVSSVFSKAGIIDLDPETQQPKIKLYRHKADHPQGGELKGDASVCYARPESVDLAITLLDGSQFRPAVLDGEKTEISVTRAKFEQHGDKFEERRERVSSKKRLVAKMAAIQAVDWDDGEFNGRLTGGRKGLRIIVLKHVFNPAMIEKSAEDQALASTEKDLREECERWGAVEKITVFSQNPEGVVIVKFVQPGAATEAVKELNGRMWKDVGVLEAHYWDGVTDYTYKDEVKEQKETEKRQEEFGSWLESQELPEELRLQTE